jgi:hypothetical protein
VDNWGAILQAGRLWVRVPMRSLIFLFNLPNPSDRLCGLVGRVPSYKSRGPGSIPGAT